MKVATIRSKGHRFFAIRRGAHAFIAIATIAVLVGCEQPASKKGAPDRQTTTASPPLEQSGPFGLAMGTPLAKLSVLKKAEGNDRYELRVPKPNTEFEMYVGTVSPTFGLCRIAAFGKTHEDDKSGTEAKGAYQELKAILTEKYGAPENSFDFLHVGAIYNESYEWAASLYKHERSLSDFWTSKKKPLPNHIDGIVLEAKAVGLSEPYVSLAYEFTNMSRCLAPAAERNKEAL